MQAFDILSFLYYCWGIEQGITTLYFAYVFPVDYKSINNESFFIIYTVFATMEIEL